MFAPLRSFSDPLLHKLLLRLSELAIALRRGHDLLGIAAEDALHQFAIIGFARQDSVTLRGLFIIES